MQPQRSLAWLALFSTLILGVCLLLTLPLSAAPSEQPRISPNIVISQIYGGGGNAGAIYKNGFIELFNRDLTPVDITNWSVQYASATGSQWLVTTLSGAISEGRYYLVQEAEGAGGSATLPAPDATGWIAMNAFSGKVALVNNQTPISIGTICPSGPGIIDFVGYGSANCYESAPAPALNNTLAAIRNAAGCTETGDNSSDFTIGTPNPRNSSSPANPCGATNSPTSTATHTSTNTPAETATPTLTQTPTETSTPAETSTDTPTDTPTPANSPTATETPTPSFTPPSTASPTNTPTATIASFPSDLFVNEFLPQPVSDWNGDGVANTEDEWIEIYNANNFGVDLGGWMLDDVSGGGSAPYVIPGGALIPARGFRVFFHAETHIALNDTGDDVQLLHPDGTVADVISYSSASPDRSYARYPDGAEFLTDDCPPSPGASNCSITPTLTPTPTAVYHLTNFADARALPLGSRITVLGSVIARPCQLDQYAHEMMLSDGTAGMDVYLPYPERLTCAIGMGEQILATGVITDHYGLRQIRLQSKRDVLRNYGAPREMAPRSIHTNKLDEEYESMLVTIKGTVVNGKNGDTIWVDDGEGAVEIEASPWSGASFAGITHGSIVRVTGVGYHYNRYKASNEGYQIRPRMPQDVTVIELAEKVPPAPGGYGKDLGAVSIATTHTTRTGNYVLVGGVVTVPPAVIGSRDFWIQDASGGVHVYVASSAGEVPLLHLWDNVTVRGRVVSHFGEREVRVEEPSSVNLFGVGAPLAPLHVRTGELTLRHEGALVEIAGAVIYERGRDIYLDDGSGEGLVYLDPDTHIHTPNLKAGDSLLVMGVVRRFQGRAELVPRFSSDLRIEAAKGTEEDAKHERTKGVNESGKGKSAKENTKEGSPTAVVAASSLTARASATATPTAPSGALALRRPRLGATTVASQMGSSLSDGWGMPFAVALLLLFSLSGGMAFTAVWKYRDRH